MKTIGFIDSGLGGITIMIPVLESFPFLNGVYIADQMYAPYGEKASKTVRMRLEKAIEVLVNRGVDMIVVACNTASTQLRKSGYDVPVIGMIKPIMDDVNHSEAKHILVLSTRLTSTSGIYQSAFEETRTKTDVKACPTLIEHVESQAFMNPGSSRFVRHRLKRLKRHRYDAVVLGCTHFGWLKDDINEAFPEADIISGTDGLIRILRRMLKKKDAAHEGTLLMCSTGDISAIRSLALSVGNRTIRYETISLEDESVESKGQKQEDS